MSFELKRKESVPDGIRRVVCERIDVAVETLNGKHRKQIGDVAVHEARKCFKEVRGALRMVRNELGAREFDRENRTFRDAGRPLSEVRDAKVLLDTLDELARHFKGKLAANPFKRLRRALQARRGDVRKRVLDQNNASREILTAVKRSARRAPSWPLRHTGWRAIAQGLRRTYRQGCEAMDKAIRDGSDEAFHEWRKRAKDLRYGIELLVRTWPEAMKPLADSLHHLTDVLGLDHDLAVLQAIVEKELKDIDADDERELLKPLVSQRRDELLKEARALGRKIYAESDRDFIDRIHGYWKAWR